MVLSRDSVPTNERAANDSTQAIAFSTAGVASMCGSSEPEG